MGSRGAFENVDMGNFTFRDHGQHYFSLGELSSDHNVKAIVQDSKSVKAPEYSHTPGRVYAVVKEGALKHLAYYDNEHKQAVSIDFAHEHQGVKPHRHVYFHENPNTECPVGRNIHAGLDDKLFSIQAAMEDKMKSITLEDVVRDTQAFINKEK